MLTAYFDESYNHAHPKRPDEPLIYSVGCWLSTDEKWERFAKRWKQILHQAGVDHFHMSKFESRLPPYNTWSNLKRISVQQKLWKTVFDNTLFGSVPMVHRADWDSMIKRRPYLSN